MESDSKKFPQNIHESSEREFANSMGNKSIDQSLAFNAEGGSISRTKENRENYMNPSFILSPNHFKSPFMRTLNSVEGSRKFSQIVATIDESIANAELSDQNRDSKMTGRQTPQMPNIVNYNQNQEKVRAHTNNSPIKPYKIQMNMTHASMFDN
jgi:hypothetical protein